MESEKGKGATFRIELPRVVTRERLRLWHTC